MWENYLLHYKTKTKTKAKQKCKTTSAKKFSFHVEQPLHQAHKSEEIDWVKLEVRDHHTDHQMTKALLDLESSKDRWAISDKKKKNSQVGLTNFIPAKVIEPAITLANHGFIG